MNLPDLQIDEDELDHEDDQEAHIDLTNSPKALDKTH